MSIQKYHFQCQNKCHRILKAKRRVVEDLRPFFVPQLLLHSATHNEMQRNVSLAVMVCYTTLLYIGFIPSCSISLFVVRKNQMIPTSVCSRKSARKSSLQNTRCNAISSGERGLGTLSWPYTI
jgi:hypothetical protein